LNPDIFRIFNESAALGCLATFLQTSKPSYYLPNQSIQDRLTTFAIARPHNCNPATFRTLAPSKPSGACVKSEIHILVKKDPPTIHLDQQYLV
jgi:hypothetical protein